MLLLSYHDLPRVTLDLQDVQRRSSGYTKPLALTDSEVVDTRMLADYAAIGRDQLAGGIGQRLALLGEVSIEKILVVAARDETYLLRVRLLRQREAVLARKVAHLGLGHPAQRKQRAAELLLGQPEEEICL